MFLDEARLSLRLNHANVVQTYEVLAGDGQLAIAMEYLDGQPLNRVLNRLLRGRSELSLPLRLRILTRVLAGLEYAHTLTDLDGSPLEVVHRDVSPQNVFVTYDGQVKLVDFGVAKTLAASHHTRPGTIKGKLAYMAPEQLQQPTVDRRADLFSVGVMLWEMLAGRRMWPGKTEVEIVGHLASGRPLPPLPLDSSLPAGLDAICERALDPDPDRRYQTAAEMEMELEAVLVGSADSHARNLGKVVSLAFAPERAERQALIDRCVRRTGSQTASAPRSSVERRRAPGDRHFGRRLRRRDIRPTALKRPVDVDPEDARAAAGGRRRRAGAAAATLLLARRAWWRRGPLVDACLSEARREAGPALARRSTRGRRGRRVCISRQSRRHCEVALDAAPPIADRARGRVGRRQAPLRSTPRGARGAGGIPTGTSPARVAAAGAGRERLPRAMPRPQRVADAARDGDRARPRRGCCWRRRPASCRTR